MNLFSDAKLRETSLDLLASLVSTAKWAFDSCVIFDDDAMKRLVTRLTNTSSKRKLTLRWLTARSIEAFLRSHLTSELHGYHADILSKPLPEIPRFSDIGAAAVRLYDALATLPWNYRLIAPLPVTACRSCGRVEIHLSEEFCVTHLEHEQPRPSTGLGLRGEEPHRHDPLYFVGEFAGYLPEEGPSADFDEFLNAWKGLMGLQLVEKAIYVSHTERGVAHKPQFIDVCKTDKGNAAHLMRQHALSAEDSALLCRLEGEDWRLHNETTDPIRRIAPAFRHQPTRTAARWYLDSFSDATGSLQIIQATVALEILLGDKSESDDVGITALLANRLAYLIGRNPIDRERILADIRRLYRLRSNVVHTGKVALDDHERSAIYELQRYVLRVLQEQVKSYAAS